MSGSPLTVALDVTSLLGPRTGVGVFTGQLVEGLARRDGIALRGFAVTWKGRGTLDGVIPANVLLGSRPMAARPLRVVWRRVDWPPIETWTGAVDLVHGPNFVVPPARRAAEVVTVHDLTAWRFPQLVDNVTAAYPALVSRAISRGVWIHTPSRFVADEVIERLEVDPGRVVTVPNAATDLPAVAWGSDDATGRRLSGGDRYILAVGTVEPRKDLPGLVRAFDVVAGSDPDVRLVVAGPDGWGADALSTAIAGARHRGRIVRLGWVDDGSRAALLRGCRILAYPSIYEGFGLVPLEAMAAGVPVVATRTGAIPEVVGDAAWLVPVGDVDALAGALTDLLTDEARRDELIAAGHRRRALFDARSTIDGMVDLYRRASDAWFGLTRGRILRGVMRLVIARCQVDYAGRLDAHLPMATRLIMVKADGCVAIHADGGAYKPLNWMNAPNVLVEGDGQWVVTNPKGEKLTITVEEIVSDVSWPLGVDPGLQKDGVEAHLQVLLAEHPGAIEDGLSLIRREHLTDIGPVDLLCHAADGTTVAVEIKRRGDIDGVEQLTRYVEFLRRDPRLGEVRGVFVVQEVRPQARVLASDRGLAWCEVDYDELRGIESNVLRLF